MNQIVFFLILLTLVSCGQTGGEEGLKYCTDTCQSVLTQDLNICSDLLAKCHNEKRSNCHDQHEICTDNAELDSLTCKSKCKNGYCSPKCEKQHREQLRKCADGDDQDDYLECKDIADNDNLQCLEDCVFNN